MHNNDFRLEFHWHCRLEGIFVQCNDAKHNEDFDPDPDDNENYDLVLTFEGVGIFNLREFLHITGLRHREAKKPMDVVLTHIHFDHSGGVHHFQDGKTRDDVKIKIHKLEAGSLRHPLKTASWIMNHEVLPKPSPDWTARSYQVQGVSNVSPIQDGEAIHLGDKTFQVFVASVWDSWGVLLPHFMKCINQEQNQILCL